MQLWMWDQNEIKNTKKGKESSGIIQSNFPVDKNYFEITLIPSRATGRCHCICFPGIWGSYFLVHKCLNRQLHCSGRGRISISKNSLDWSELNLTYIMLQPRTALEGNKLWKSQGKNIAVMLFSIWPYKALAGLWKSRISRGIEW